MIDRLLFDPVHAARQASTNPHVGVDWPPRGCIVDNVFDSLVNFAKYICELPLLDTAARKNTLRDNLAPKDVIGEELIFSLFSGTDVAIDANKVLYSNVPAQCNIHCHTD